MGRREMPSLLGLLVSVIHMRGAGVGGAIAASSAKDPAQCCQRQIPQDVKPGTRGGSERACRSSLPTQNWLRRGSIYCLLPPSSSLNPDTHCTFCARDPSRPEDLFAPMAHSAAMLFADVDRKRVRKCGQCVLHFYDTSKKGTRRWCSMQMCGNRLKVGAYAARRRAIDRN
jgi:hypothetical protein